MASKKSSAATPPVAPTAGQVADRQRAILFFGGRVVNPLAYPNTVAGFNDYLAASGVNTRFASAAEMTRPHQPDIAWQLGYSAFLPPQAWWPKGAALALLQNRLREKVGAPIVIRNWWRPADYNRRVATSGDDSDHPLADAADFDFQTSEQRAVAQRDVDRWQREEPWLELSVGRGDRVLHVGIQHGTGIRNWRY